MHAPTSEVRQAGLNLLPDVDAVHEIVPRRGLWETSNELDGLRLNALTLRGCGRHGMKLGTAIDGGKWVFWLTFKMSHDPRWRGSCCSEHET
jgi:hypothetical protein